ncbi:UbiA family prenyltransferase [Methylobacterium sp. WSM2598]|uniref:UbiA family prenyltransferase n=1 Tax=Methylobacterium sp. WSM2598 TaxID=398261 RepID=UPI00039EAC66|nr:UbiA family prenyltransferase [Methylobacterium sp. WSM2598]
MTHPLSADAASRISAEHAQPRPSLPLVIGLDDALQGGSALLEGALSLLRSDTPGVLTLLLRGPGGRAVLEDRVARAAALAGAARPLNEEALAFAEARARRGCPIWLLTEDDALARRVAERLPAGTRVLAPDAALALPGEARAARLADLFPEGFAYAGAAGADQPVFARAREAALVGAAPGVVRAVRALGRPVTAIEGPSRPRALARAARLHQWAKNGLVVLPLVLGGKAGDPAAWGRAVLTFLALGLVASASYLLNDLWDLPHDRAHWSKRRRPLASGDLPLPTACSPSRRASRSASGSRPGPVPGCSPPCWPTSSSPWPIPWPSSAPPSSTRSPWGACSPCASRSASPPRR